jgi:UDP-N-acetylmuramate dehydrogenase
MRDLTKTIKEKFPQVMLNEKLSKYSTFLVGGPADYFLNAKKTEEIQEAIEFAKAYSLPYFILGKGSNILFDDKGFRGLIIKIETENVLVDNDKVTADAGVNIARLIQFSIENGLSGLEKWIGLPGTVGGAVRGNAGCNGLETKDILVNATILNPKTGEIKEVDNEYLQYAYRESKLKKVNEIVLSATFRLNKDQLTKEQQQKIMTEIRKFRLTMQPSGSSSGSFFKNPLPDKPAGMLIDRAGLKGTKVGNAQISEKHGNFLLNLGGATADDIKKLALLAKKTVIDKFGIELHEEVQILSESGATSL